MSTVFSPLSRMNNTRKNRNVVNAINSFYCLNSSIRMKKISYQADQINKLSIPVSASTLTKTKSKSPTALTQRASHITPQSTTNTTKPIKKRFFSPTTSTTSNNSFMTIKVTKNKSPNRQSDLSLSHYTEGHTTLLSCGNEIATSKGKKPKIMLPYSSLITCNVNHKKQHSVPYFHLDNISTFTKIPIKVKKDQNRKSRSNSRSPLKTFTPLKNRLTQANLTKQSSKAFMSIPNYHNQTIHTIQTSNSNSFVIKKKPQSLSRAERDQHCKTIQSSSSENNYCKVSSMKTIAVHKNIQKEETAPTLKRMHIPSTCVVATSSNISFKDLLHHVKIPEKTSRNSEISLKTNNSITNNETLSSKSNSFAKTVHSIAKISQTGFAGFNKSKTNQDSLFIYSSEGNEYHFIGVCDGHGNNGHLVSNYLSNALPLILKKELNERDTVLSSTNNFQIHKVIENSFILANSKLSNESSIDTNFSGSTCISVLFSTEKIYCANVGDSRAILGKYSKNSNKWDCFPLSRDHKPSEYDEAKRIMRFNGRIEPFREEDGTFVGPLRVWLKTESIPGLAMTRSFGDQIASSVGVISEPEIKDLPFKEEDKFIILASDGLWEYMTNEECMEVIIHYYQHTKDSESAVRELYKKAFRAWVENDPTIDDITIILIFLS